MRVQGNKIKSISYQSLLWFLNCVSQLSHECQVSLNKSIPRRVTFIFTVIFDHSLWGHCRRLRSQKLGTWRLNSWSTLVQLMLRRLGQKRPPKYRRTEIKTLRRSLPYFSLTTSPARIPIEGKARCKHCLWWATNCVAFANTFLTI